MACTQTEILVQCSIFQATTTLVPILSQLRSSHCQLVSHVLNCLLIVESYTATFCMKLTRSNLLGLFARCEPSTKALVCLTHPLFFFPWGFHVSDCVEGGYLGVSHCVTNPSQLSHLDFVFFTRSCLILSKNGTNCLQIV